MEYSVLKKQFGQLAEIYAQVDAEDQENFRDKVLIAYGQYVIDTLEGYFEPELQEELIPSLIDFFKANERLVRGSLCEYTSIPSHEITEFIIDCVRYVVTEEIKAHAQDPTQPLTSILRHLFPSVKSFEKLTKDDVINLEDEDIDEVINQYALTVNGEYFISVLDTIEALVNTHTKQVDKHDPICHNPFGDGHWECNYSNEDLQKVKNHSPLTREIVTLKEEEARLLAKDGSLLSAVLDLVSEFRFKGVEGIGNETIAAVGAETALLRFVRFWEALPADKKAIAEEITDFQELIESFILSSTVKNESRVLIVNGKIVAEIEPNGVVKLKKTGYSQKTEEGKTTLFNKKDLPIAILENNSLLWKRNEKVILEAKTHVGEPTTCVNGWQKQLNQIIDAHKATLASISVNEDTLQEQIVSNQNALDQSLKMIKACFEQKSYVGDNPYGSISLGLLETLNIEFSPETIDETLSAFHGISAEDMEEIYQQYQAEINQTIEELEDLVICAIELAPEKFQIILRNIDASFINEWTLSKFLTIEFVSMESKKVLAKNIRRFIGDTKFFCQVIRQISHSLFSLEEKQSFLTPLIIEILSQELGFCENIHDLCDVIAAISHAAMEPKQKQKILISLISLCLKEHDEFFETHWQLRQMIDAFSQSALGFDERSLLIPVILEQLEKYIRSNQINNEGFVLLIDGISQSSLLKEEKQRLLNDFIARGIEEHACFCEDNVEFRITITSLSKAILTEEMKQKFLTRFVEQAINEYGCFCKKNSDFASTIEKISKSMLPINDKEKLMIVFVDKIIGKHFGIHKNSGDFARVINKLRRSGLSKEVKQKCLLLFIEKTIETFTNEKEQVMEFCNSNRKFRDIIESIDKSTINQLDKQRYLEELIGKSIETACGFCTKHSDFIETLTAIVHSSLTLNVKEKILKNFIEKTIKMHQGFCVSNLDFCNTVHAIQNIQVESFEDIKLLNDYIQMAIANDSVPCKNKIEFFNTIEVIADTRLSTEENLGLLKAFIDYGLQETKIVSLEHVICWLQTQKVLGSHLEQVLTSTLKEEYQLVHKGNNLYNTFGLFQNQAPTEKAFEEEKEAPSQAFP